MMSPPSGGAAGNSRSAAFKASDKPILRTCDGRRAANRWIDERKEYAMKCHSARGASLVILLAALTSTAWCQDTGLPSMFPLPPLPQIGSGYPVARAAASDGLWGQEQISP